MDPGVDRGFFASAITRCENNDSGYIDARTMIVRPVWTDLLSLISLCLPVCTLLLLDASSEIIFLVDQLDPGNGSFDVFTTVFVAKTVFIKLYDDRMLNFRTRVIFTRCNFTKITTVNIKYRFVYVKFYVKVEFPKR